MCVCIHTYICSSSAPAPFPHPQGGWGWGRGAAPPAPPVALWSCGPVAMCFCVPELLWNTVSIIEDSQPKFHSESNLLCWMQVYARMCASVRV